MEFKKDELYIFKNRGGEAIVQFKSLNTDRDGSEEVIIKMVRILHATWERVEIGNAYVVLPKFMHPYIELSEDNAFTEIVNNI